MVRNHIIQGFAYRHGDNGVTAIPKGALSPSRETESMNPVRGSDECLI